MPRIRSCPLVGTDPVLLADPVLLVSTDPVLGPLVGIDPVLVSGKALSTEHAGGVEKFSVTASTPHLVTDRISGKSMNAEMAHPSVKGKILKIFGFGAAFTAAEDQFTTT